MKNPLIEKDLNNQPIDKSEKKVIIFNVNIKTGLNFDINSKFFVLFLLAVIKYRGKNFISPSLKWSV